MARPVDGPARAPVRRLLLTAGRSPFVTIAIVVALASCVAVPPDAAYLDYIDVRTLVCLACLLAVVTALDRVHVFTAVGERVVRLVRTRRGLVSGLVLATLLASMLVSNDMALVSFLPLAAVTLGVTGNGESLAPTFVLQTVAANLGGMITPFGSPQNLFLYQHFHIALGPFVGALALPFAVSVVVILAGCALVRPVPVGRVDATTPYAVRPTLLYAGLFAVVVAVVLRVVPLPVAALVPLTLLVTDRGALRRMDHGLIATFVAFFVFAGNAVRMPALHDLLTGLARHDALLGSALCSQLLSNVPTAILLAPFTSDWAPLLVGVNVGGVGTLVASLASLITLRRYQALRPDHVRRYLALFTAVNVGMLVLLLAVTEAFPPR